MTISNAYLLKVLTGAQAGAEVSVGEAEYVLGSGADDDLRFVDVSLKPGHARLRLVDGAIKVAGGSGTVKTRAGISVLAGDETWHNIDPFDIITIGTTSFAIGPSSADWSVVDTLAPIRERRNSSIPPPITTEPRWDIRRFATVAAIAIVTVVLIGWFVGRPSQVADNAEAQEERSDVVIITDALTEFPFSDGITVSEAVDGVISAEGYVNTPVERRALRNAVDETSIPVRFRVWARAVIENETQAIVDNQQIPVEFSVGKDGVLTLRGDILDQNRVDQLVASITQNVSGILQVDMQVRTANTYLEQIRLLLARSELDDSVVVRLDGTLIEANGVVIASKIDNWVGFIQSYARRYADQIALRSFVQLVDDNGKVISDPVLSQPGVPVIIGSVDALEQGPLADPAFSPAVEDLGTNGSGLSASTALNNAMDNFPLDTLGNPSVTSPSNANVTPIRPVSTTTNNIGALELDSVGVVLDLDRLKEGSFGANEVFKGLNTSAQQNQEVPANRTSQNFGTDAQPADVEIAPTTLSRRFLTRAARPESISGARVLHSMTKAVLAETTGSTPPAAYVADFQQLNDLEATLDQMKHLWSATLNRQADQDAYFDLLVNPITDFTECWDNSIAAFGNLPNILFWLDYLSMTDEIDISVMNTDAQVLLIEAALNPNRLAACAARFSDEREIDIESLSLYLQEIKVNPEFIRFIVRRLDPYPLGLSGVNLAFQNRYAQLSDGKRLNEGVAPDPSILLVNVGELGLLLKEKDRLLILLYGTSLRWKSGG